MSPPSHPSQHCHTAAFPRDSIPCPCSCQPSPHLPQLVCQGIRFCAILNNSIFIGPTKKHLFPLCALPGHGLLTPTIGHIALSAFPVPLSLCAPPQKPSRAPVIPSLLGAGRGAWCQEPALATSMGTPGMGTGCVPAGSNQRKSLAMPSSGLLAPGCRGGLYFCTFISVVSHFQSPACPHTTRKH